MAKKAGVPWVSAHSFRHTCASLLFAGGKNQKQGRSGSATTQPATRWTPTSTCSTAGWR